PADGKRIAGLRERAPLMLDGTAACASGKGRNRFPSGQSMRPAHVALALLINVVWGFTFVAAKAGVSVFPPVWFSGLRFVLIAILLAPWIRPLGPRFHTVLPIALLAGALHYACMYAGLSIAGQVSSVSIAAQL